jgi:hypothetical protein
MLTEQLALVELPPEVTTKLAVLVPEVEKLFVQFVLDPVQAFDQEYE